MKTRDIILVGLFAALSAVGAFIKIPIGPAPITLQILFITLAGVLLGSKLGALSQLIYVIIGLSGVPVFTKGGGLHYVLDPTFGYLIGFIVGAYIIGKITENLKSISFVKLFIACLIGLAATYLIGVPYLYMILKTIIKSDITFMGALKSGLVVFIPGDLLKCILTSAIGIKVIPLLKRQNLISTI